MSHDPICFFVDSLVVNPPGGGGVQSAPTSKIGLNYENIGPNRCSCKKSASYLNWCGRAPPPSSYITLTLNYPLFNFFISITKYKNQSCETCNISFWTVAPKCFDLATCVGKKGCREPLDLFIAPSLSSLAWKFYKLVSYAYCVPFRTTPKNLYYQFLNHSAKTLRDSDLCRKEIV